jgi:8-oxo-dGTP pyrophosphatase MutT (NUDIX family)
MKDKTFGIIPFYKDLNDYHFLLIRHNAGHWAFPKGHQQMGETPIDTAMREFSEETGLTDYKIIEGTSFIEGYSFINDGLTIEKTVEYFLAYVNDISKVSIQQQEIQDFKWASFDDAIGLITFKECRELFVKVNDYIKDIYNGSAILG